MTLRVNSPAGLLGRQGLSGPPWYTTWDRRAAGIPSWPWPGWSRRCWPRARHARDRPPPGGSSAHMNVGQLNDFERLLKARHGYLDGFTVKNSALIMPYTHSAAAMPVIAKAAACGCRGIKKRSSFIDEQYAQQTETPRPARWMLRRREAWRRLVGLNFSSRLKAGKLSAARVQAPKRGQMLWQPKSLPRRSPTYSACPTAQQKRRNRKLHTALFAHAFLLCGNHAGGIHRRFMVQVYHISGMRASRVRSDGPPAPGGPACHLAPISAHFF